MNHEQAFLEAIRQEPEDDTHRLVFADWLDERDDPRGRFIRCQVQAEQRPLCDPERLTLEEEARDQFERHRQDWLTDIATSATRWTFRRGFLDSISLSKDAFLALPPRLFEQHPLTSAELILEPADRSPADLDDLAGCSHLRHLERLGLVHRFLADGPLESLLASPHLTRLRALNLSGTYLTGRWLGEVTRFPVLDRIEELDLSVCPFLHDRVVRALVDSRQIGILRRLHLGGTALTPFGLIALLRPFRLDNLVDLEIGVMNVPALAEASRRAVRELAESPAMERLLALSLRGGVLDGERAGLLFQAPLANLRELHIVGCELTGAACQALARARHLRSLTHLNLTANRLNGDDLAVLANSPLLATVERLALADNLLSSTGLAILAQSSIPTRLACLDLARNRLTGPGVRALLHSPLAAGLRELNLADNGAGQVGTEALATSAQATRLTALDLSLNRIESGAIELLAESPNLNHLTRLDLSYNPLGDRGARALAGTPHLGRLRRLDLRQTQMGRDGVRALLASTTLPQLEELDLRGNEVTHDELPRLRARFQGRVQL